MPTQEGFLTVILAAIVANLLLAVGLLAYPWIQRRRHRAPDIDDAETSRRVLLRAHLFGSAEGAEAPVPAWAGHGRAEAFDQMNPSVAELLVPMGERPSDDQPRVFAAAERAEPADPEQGEIDDAPLDRAVERRWEGDRDEPSDVVQKDAVTGFDGPATWAKRLTEENARVQRYGRAATVVLVELAGVDRLAERLGPAAADRLIPPIATTMRRHARSADSLARLSPTRFAVLLPDTDEVKAINYVERVRAACDVWLEAGAVSLRLSIGWAEVNPNQPVDPAVQIAEQRLNTERHRLRGRDPSDVDDRRDPVPGPMRAARAN